jgi:hypothetical protein
MQRICSAAILALDVNVAGIIVYFWNWRGFESRDAFLAIPTLKNYTGTSILHVQEIKCSIGFDFRDMFVANNEHRRTSSPASAPTNDLQCFAS